MVKLELAAEVMAGVTSVHGTSSISDSSSYVFFFPLLFSLPSGFSLFFHRDWGMRAKGLGSAKEGFHRVRSTPNNLNP